MLYEVNKRCPGCDRHVLLQQGRAKDAAHYTAGLCRALVNAMEVQEKFDAEVLSGLDEMNILEAHDDELCQLGDTYTDERTGEVLDSKLTKEARSKEVNTMEVMGVYWKVLRQLATARGKKIVGVRWIDTNKAR